MDAATVRTLRRLLRAGQAACAVWLAAVIVQLLIADPALAHNCSTFSDCFNVMNSAAEATFGLTLLASLSLVLDFVPVVGDVKGVVESVTGRDLLTGEELEPWERALGLIPLLPASDLLRAAGKVDDIADLARHADDAADVARHTDEAADVARHTGARSTLGMSAYRRWEEYAPRAYDEIRNADDVADVARHSGYDVETIERIKNHVFEAEHQLDDGVRRFDPDPDIADAWQRLRDGEPTPEDLRLLAHEEYESRFEREFGTDYRTAHEAANNAGHTWNPPDELSDLD